ncbi:NAD-dependent epimerase/dehydratase family protein [Methylorubrum extorquens]
MADSNEHELFDGKYVLVTGAGGFIGRHLVSALDMAGAYVTGFGRSNEAFDSSNIRWVNGDFSDPMSLARACEGQDIVYHLLNSSTPASSTQNPVGDINSNLVPSVLLLEAAADAGISDFIFFSSGGTVYGQSTDIIKSETGPTDPQSAYGISKLAIEKYCRLICESNGINYKVLRLSNPYGPGQSPFKKQGIVAVAIHAALSGQRFDLWGDGEVIRDFIFIDDVVRAAMMVVAAETKHHIFNVGSGVGRTINNVIDDIARVASVDFKLVKHPSRTVDVSSNILDVSRLKSTGWSLLVPWQVGLGRTMNWIDREYKSTKPPSITNII